MGFLIGAIIGFLIGLTSAENNIERKVKKATTLEELKKWL